MSYAVRHEPAAPGFAGGVVVFAGVMLFIVGVLDVLRGVVGIAEDPVLVNTADYTFAFDTAGWGWVHLALGVVTILVSLGLFRDALWARIVGTLMAGLVLISSFLSLPYYPLWSIVVITISGFVIWALCTDRSKALRA